MLMGIGLCAGLVVSTFSKPLAIVLGLFIAGVTVCKHHNLKQKSKYMI